ncbi:hypothetical protein PMAYCL1PPCAC_05002, partial [Pristionchus mayeri]
GLMNLSEVMNTESVEGNDQSDTAIVDSLPRKPSRRKSGPRLQIWNLAMSDDYVERSSMTVHTCPQCG